MAEQTDPRLQRAINVLVSMQRTASPAAIEAFMPYLRKDAELLLAEIDGPEPDWADLREMARHAGFTMIHQPIPRVGICQFRIWCVRDGDEVVIEFQPSGSGGDRVHFRGPGGYMELLGVTPSAVLTAARLVGLGGSDE